MIIHEFNKPIPVIVESDKEGYAIYVESGGQFENDIWAVVLCEGGIIKHYRSDQIRVYKNSTFDIKSDHNEKKTNKKNRQKGKL
jgi:hypothetical protein